MELIHKENWAPVGVADLEQSAYDALESIQNTLVVAGPGAGKTELLAQRANYLLTTGICSNPKKILAISFKRDAAINLAERVNLRSGDYSGRFDSMTLDGFAKNLVDRFFLALPENWQPKPNYLVRTSAITEQNARDWFNRAFIPSGHQRPNMADRSKVQVAALIDKVMHGTHLPYDTDITVLHSAFGKQWWSEQLSLPTTEPSLTFPMLNRLAAYLLRANPNISKALRTTYSHVFLDEFQDTTMSQWDLICSAFSGSTCVVTAVGDDKQRIMSWAGADPEIFEKYKKAFSSEIVSLTRNYRSAPNLVRIQHAIAQTLDNEILVPYVASANKGDGTCVILGFETPEAEAVHIADFISNEIKSGASPRDFCILARQSTGAMITLLHSELQRRGVAIRDESILQDLLAEPLTKIVLLALRLAIAERDPLAWSDLTNEISMLAGLTDDLDGMDIEKLVASHKSLTRDHLKKIKTIGDLPSEIVRLIGADRYKIRYQQYMNGNYLEKVSFDLGSWLNTSLERTGSVSNLLAELLGENVVPAMSIHKSKGLEFKTVIFMGLEDEQWWNFRNQPAEEKRAFFVAFSRAMSSVIFTFSNQRLKWGRTSPTSRKQIGALFDILKSAGVELIDKSR
jgi:DNA helicase II / ATP-dependent DNA helicase PcrA